MFRCVDVPGAGVCGMDGLVDGWVDGWVDID